MFSETTFLCATQADGRLGLAEIRLDTGRCRCAFASRQLGEQFLERLDAHEKMQLRPFEELAADALYGSTDSLILFDGEAAIHEFIREMHAVRAGLSGPGDLLSASDTDRAQLLANHHLQPEIGP